MLHRPKSAWSVVLAMCLTACATPPKPLYQWGGYQNAVYAHLKGDDSDASAQIAKLEEQVQKTEAAGQAVPPGLHGHLALLYSRSGDEASARRHLESERTLFPESTAYVDFLLKNTARDKPAAAAAAASAAAPATPKL